VSVQSIDLIDGEETSFRNVRRQGLTSIVRTGIVEMRPRSSTLEHHDFGSEPRTN